MMFTRVTKIVAGITVASLTLAACGAGVKQTITSALKSVGSQPYVQMHLTANVSGDGANAAQAASIENVLAKLSYDVAEQSTTGGAISSADGQVNSSITVNVDNTPVITVIEISNTIYFKFDLTPLTTFPQLSATLAHELPVVQLTFGNRWFELPSSVVSAYLPSKQQYAAQQSKQAAIEAKLIDAITAVIEKNPYTTTDNGFAQTGTLDSLAAGLEPTIATLNHQAATAVGHTAGTYHVTLGLNGATATDASIGITAPNNGANMSVTLAATIAHDATAVTAPSNPTVITQQLLSSLGASGL